MDARSTCHQTEELRQLTKMNRTANTILATLCGLSLLPCPLQCATPIPLGTTLEIRLQQEVNSYSSEEGSSVQGVVTAPIIVEGKMWIPIGSIAMGVVRKAQRVGLGLFRETATLNIEFTQLQLPDGQRLHLKARTIEVENAREKVKDGNIQGIRSTATPGHRASGLITSLAAVDPIALAFSTAASAALMRFSEPEIRLPVGTELLVRTMEPINATAEFANPVKDLSSSEEEHESLHSAIRAMPYRTRAFGTGVQSDITNLLFIGSIESLQRAFAAAGWVAPAEDTAYSKYRTLLSYAENQSYHEAPMSSLVLDGKHTTLTMSKMMNTFAKRHHVRIFVQPEKWRGQTVFTASSTQDIGIGFSKEKRSIIHIIDQRIDNERAKVVNDLVFTGCVEAMENLERPWIPLGTKNATGDKLLTDGAISIIKLNACESPRRFDEMVSSGPGPFRGNQAQRIGRQAILTVRNDVIRGNFIWQGVSGAIYGVKILKRQGKERSERPIRNMFVDGERYIEASGEMEMIEPASTNGPHIHQPRIKSQSDPWEAPRVELGMDFGYLRFGEATAGAEGLLIHRRFPMPGFPDQFAIIARNEIHSGISIGGSVTLNTSRWLSHELGLHYQRGSFKLGLQSVSRLGSEDLPTVQEQKAGLTTRQFSYNTLVSLRPSNNRFRPYVAVGPVFQLINLSDSPFIKARGIFRFGLNNIGMIQSAYNFGNAAPLEGGGIFQPGVQFGGGFKYRVKPRWTMRFDFRDTFSQRPDFLTKSIADPSILNIDPDAPPPSYVTPLQRGRFSQQRATLGFSFAF